jgi:nucleotide-binding universal stress UspA family protein
MSRPFQKILVAIDFEVMATHGRKGVRRLLIGNVTEQVLRESPRPVVVISFE